MTDSIAVLAQSGATGTWRKVHPQPLREFRTYAAAVEWLAPRVFDAELAPGVPPMTHRFAVVLSSEAERFQDDPLDVTHVLLEVRVP